MKILMSLMRISVLLLFGMAGMMFSCSQFPTRDGKLQPYVNSFIEDMGYEKDRIDGYTVRFETLSHLNAGTIGYCQPLSKRIRIDPTYWYGPFVSEKSRTALVYHELGHCVCYEAHDDSLLPDKCPTTIMHHRLTSNTCLQRHWDYYVEELFQRCD